MAEVAGDFGLLLGRAIIQNDSQDWRASIRCLISARIQNSKKLLEDLIDREVVVTQKYDGASATFFVVTGNDGKPSFSTCSRNLVLTEQNESNSHYFAIEKKYDLKSKMESLDTEIAIQGEIIGPKINSNRHCVVGIDFFVFNIFSIKENRYFSHDKIVEMVTRLKLKMVPVVYWGMFKKEWLDMQNLLEWASEQKYNNGTKVVPAEGLVVKTSESKNRISFKVISNKYLMKYNL